MKTPVTFALWALKPLVTLGLVVAFVAAGVGEGSGDSGSGNGVAIAIALVGGFLNVWHYALLKRAAPTLARPEALRTGGGLFGLIRHPMYLGELILGLGLALGVGGGVAVAVWAANAGLVAVLTVLEDRQMARSFGERHRQWCAGTKRLLPGVF